MSVTKLKNGKWQARVSAFGRKKTKCFSKKAEAQRWKTEIRSQLNKTVAMGMASPAKTLGEACDDWFARKVSGRKSVNTQREYKVTIDSYVNKIMGFLELGQIQAKHGDQFVSILNKKGLAPRTVNKHLGLLKQVLTFCEAEGWIDRSPLRFVANLKEPPKKVVFLSKAEVSDLLFKNQDEPITEALLMVAVNTGMRRGEICGLCWDSVDLDRGMITVCRKMERKKIVDNTKSNKIRYIPINDTLSEYLRHLEARRNVSNVVITHADGTYVDDTHISRRMKRALAKAKVKNIRFHDLRHTYASQFMMSGGNIYDLQKILGHASLKDTQIYAHLSPDYLPSIKNTVQFGRKNLEKFPKRSQKNLQLVK